MAGAIYLNLLQESVLLSIPENFNENDDFY